MKNLLLLSSFIDAINVWDFSKENKKLWNCTSINFKK
jgi:hypothetical protein